MPTAQGSLQDEQKSSYVSKNTRLSSNLKLYPSQIYKFSANANTARKIREQARKVILRYIAIGKYITLEPKPTDPLATIP